MTREEKEELLSKIWDLPKPKDDSNYWQGVDDVADLISNMPITEGEKGTLETKIKRVEYGTDGNLYEFYTSGGYVVPEREKGEWIKMGGFMIGPTYKCSNCGNRVIIEYGKKYKCCPNCEADMRGGKE